MFNDNDFILYRHYLALHSIAAIEAAVQNHFLNCQEKVEIIFCFSVWRLDSFLFPVVAWGQPISLSRCVIALYQGRWHLKSNPEYLSLGVLATVHCDRPVKICFMPCSGHVCIENWLQAAGIRKEIYMQIHLCVCWLHQMSISILSPNSGHFCHIGFRGDVAAGWRAGGSLCCPRSNNEPFIISVMMCMSVLFISAWRSWLVLLSLLPQ